MKNYFSVKTILLLLNTIFVCSIGIDIADSSSIIKSNLRTDKNLRHHFFAKDDKTEDDNSDDVGENGGHQKKRYHWITPTLNNTLTSFLDLQFKYLKNDYKITKQRFPLFFSGVSPPRKNFT